jgi:hypothetical protein
VSTNLSKWAAHYIVRRNVAVAFAVPARFGRLGSSDCHVARTTPTRRSTGGFLGIFQAPLSLKLNRITFGLALSGSLSYAVQHFYPVVRRG